MSGEMFSPGNSHFLVWKSEASIDSQGMRRRLVGLFLVYCATQLGLSHGVLLLGCFLTYFAGFESV